MHVRTLAAAALLFAIPAFAQTPSAEPPKPEAVPCETPDEVTARVHFERALRAFLEGKKEDARHETKAGLDASPNGRFAAALRDLDKRMEAGQMPAVGTTRELPNARAEMIGSATLTGGLLGGLGAAALETDGKAAVGLVMAGTAIGLVSSIAATSGGKVKPAYPQMFGNGVGYGAFATLSMLALSDAKGNWAGPVALGILGGGLAGLGAVSALDLTGGDTGAAGTGVVFAAGLPVLVALTVAGDSSNEKPFIVTALVGGTIGLIGGPIVNRHLNWSLARWRLVSLGGYVGALFGIGTAVLADAKGRGGAALTAVGATAGLGLAGWLTSGIDADEPREQRRALLDVAPDGKVRLGSLTESIHPAVIIGKSGRAEAGAQVSLLAGRF